MQFAVGCTSGGQIGTERDKAGYQANTGRAMTCDARNPQRLTAILHAYRVGPSRALPSATRPSASTLWRAASRPHRTSAHEWRNHAQFFHLSMRTSQRRATNERRAQHGKPAAAGKGGKWTQPTHIFTVRSRPPLTSLSATKSTQYTSSACPGRSVLILYVLRSQSCRRQIGQRRDRRCQTNARNGEKAGKV